MDYYYFKQKAKKYIKIIKELVEKHQNTKDDKLIFLINHYNHILQKILGIMKHQLNPNSL
jgi:ribosomal protein L31E